ncbi:hypothetical protein PoB_003357300 [Plakobranchus ocellatus]|uniref:Uncharacterized protein n=1 Tax=Plakobranchus ocellatus TaxID=259542 RepID=A0AAV4AJW3_9GAST|nr:hypothetical protein PoB_003357300 [Plakobranchus ocellatus]
MLQAKVHTKAVLAERPRMYRPVERTGVCKKALHHQSYDSPYLSQAAPQNNKNLSFCLTVKPKDICPTRPDKVKLGGKPQVIKIPSETSKVTPQRKPLSARPQTSENVAKKQSRNTSVNLNKNKCDGRKSSEKERTMKTCAIIRASSRGFLQIPPNATSTKEKLCEKHSANVGRENKVDTNTSKPYKNSFGRLLSRTRLNRTSDAISVRNLLTTTSSVDRTKLIASASRTAANGSRNRKIPFTSSDMRVKQNGGLIGSSEPEKQANISFDNSRSKSSAGHYVASTDAQLARQTKSARPQRCLSENRLDPNDFGLDQPTVARLAARLEGHVIENNGQNIIATLTPLDAQARGQVINFRVDPSTSSSPFFRACQLSRLQIAEWLMRECAPDLEQTGVFLQPGDATLYQVLKKIMSF